MNSVQRSESGGTTISETCASTTAQHLIRIILLVVNDFRWFFFPFISTSSCICFWVCSLNFLNRKFRKIIYWLRVIATYAFEIVTHSLFLSIRFLTFVRIGSVSTTFEPSYDKTKQNKTPKTQSFQSANNNKIRSKNNNHNHNRNKMPVYNIIARRHKVRSTTSISYVLAYIQMGIEIMPLTRIHSKNNKTK